MRGSKDDIPAKQQPWGTSHSLDWGAMVADLSMLKAGFDTAPITKGLPGDACSVPHWGFVLKGRVRMRYTDGHEEVLTPDDLYFMPPGHNLLVEEDVELVTFSPKTEMDHMRELVMAKMAAGQQAETTGS